MPDEVQSHRRQGGLPLVFASLTLQLRGLGRSLGKEIPFRCATMCPEPVARPAKDYSQSGITIRPATPLGGVPEVELAKGGEVAVELLIGNRLRRRRSRYKDIFLMDQRQERRRCTRRR